MDNTEYYKGFKFTRYPDSKNRSERCYYSGWVNGKKKRLHRYKYECEIGEVGKGFHIHHIDGNPLNNDITNLERKCRIKHASEHQKDRVETDKVWFGVFTSAGIEAAKTWHKSEEGRKWHKEKAAKSGFGKFDYGKADCLECGAAYDKKTLASKFCSNKCKASNRRKSGVDNIKKECAKCKNVFEANKHQKIKNCNNCKRLR